jgi:signal transduction histidine kinase
MNDSLAEVQHEALLQKATELEQKLQQLQQENEDLRRQIADHQALIADLNAFSHMVAHDLKNPLTALTGYSFLLTTRLRDTQDTTVLRFLQVIDQTSTRMARIIDALLLLASVRQQTVVLQKLDMVKIMEEVESRVELAAFQYRAQIIKPKVWPDVMGYAPWIEEVWWNYISNAVKYGGTPPVVEIGAVPLPDGKIRFWVRDNGDGLSRESMAGLFTVNTDNGHPEFIPMEGQGLGLSIVKRIIDRLGGEVAVESANLPGEGCIFSFTLPQAPITAS